MKPLLSATDTDLVPRFDQVVLLIISLFMYIMMLDYNQEPRSGTKEHPTVHDSVEQRCSNHSSQVMALFGTQLRNSCYRSYIHVSVQLLQV